MANYWNAAARLAHQKEMQRLYDWRKLPKASRQAAILYPHLAEPSIQVAMREISAGEGRRAPGQQTLPMDTTPKWVSQLGGVAKRSK
jgi:hypothetical protein